MTFVSSSVKQRWLFAALRLQALSVWVNTSWRGAGKSGQALQAAPDSQCEHRGCCIKRECLEKRHQAAAFIATELLGRLCVFSASA